MAEEKQKQSRTIKIFKWFVAPEFFLLLILGGIWWTAQLSLAGYLVYRMYQFVAA